MTIVATVHRHFISSRVSPIYLPAKTRQSQSILASRHWKAFEIHNLRTKGKKDQLRVENLWDKPFLSKLMFLKSLLFSSCPVFMQAELSELKFTFRCFSRRAESAYN